MANEEQLALLKQGVNVWNAWRREKDSIKIDLSGADLTEADLSSRANLSKADLSEANLTRADLSGANLSKADLSRVEFYRADLSRVEFYRANLTGAGLHEANLSGAYLSEANLSEANLTRANLSGADLYGANLYRANLTGANLNALLRAQHAKNLETSLLSKDARDFELCFRPLPELWFDWERFRTVGRLPLFGLSYTTLILIPFFFYALAFYNEKVELIRNFAETLTSTTPPPADISGSFVILLHDVVQRGAVFLSTHLTPQLIPRQSLLLLLSTLCLGIASTLYTFFCPSRIKEFSRDQWCDQLNKPLLHYWPLAWKYRWLRLLCAVFYTVGGIGVLWVILTKVYRAVWFIVNNSELPHWFL